MNKPTYILVRHMHEMETLHVCCVPFISTLNEILKGDYLFVYVHIFVSWKFVQTYGNAKPTFKFSKNLHFEKLGNKVQMWVFVLSLT